MYFAGRRRVGSVGFSVERRLAAGGEAGSNEKMAERDGGDEEPESKWRTRSMTRQARLEQSAPALCVDVLEIASSRKRA